MTPILVVDISDRKFNPCQGNLPSGTPGLIITTAAAELCNPADIMRITGEHYRIEQGQSDDEDHATNLDALRTGARIFTVHNVGTKTSPKPIWIITDAALGEDPLDRTDRPTTIMDPRDY